MNENWCDLVHEANEDGESCLGPTVLYTSRLGLRNLANELHRIASVDRLGRFELNIAEMDQGCYAPFTHVEVAEKPPEEAKRSKGNNRAIYWFFGVLVGVPLLALYGVVRLAMDIIG